MITNTTMLVDSYILGLLYLKLLHYGHTCVADLHRANNSDVSLC